MIQKVTNELEGFKAKLQQTIDHVQSGVNHLNEDQVEKAVVMLHALYGEFDDVIDNCMHHLQPEPVSSSVEPPTPPSVPEPAAVDPLQTPPPGTPSTADLDAVAEENAAADATGSPVEWSSNQAPKDESIS